MTNEEQLKMQQFMLKGVMADLPNEDRQKIYDAIESIEHIVKPLGEHGLMALSLCVCQAGIEHENKK